MRFLYLGHADGVGDLERTSDARQRRHLLGVRGRVELGLRIRVRVRVRVGVSGLGVGLRPGRGSGSGSERAFSLQKNTCILVQSAPSALRLASAATTDPPGMQSENEPFSSMHDCAAAVTSSQMLVSYPPARCGCGCGWVPWQVGTVAGGHLRRTRPNPSPDPRRCRCGCGSSVMFMPCHVRAMHRRGACAHAMDGTRAAGLAPRPGRWPEGEGVHLRMCRARRWRTVEDAHALDLPRDGELLDARHARGRGARHRLRRQARGEHEARACGEQRERH